MGFKATLTTTGHTAVIALRGTLDEDSDEEFREQIEHAATLDVSELVLDMSALEHLSTAGLRTVAYVRQRMADDVRMVIISPAEPVRQTLLAADFDDSVAIRE